MIKKIKTEEAIGYPLLHDITGIMPDGFKGVLFKRNHIIKDEDIETLKDIGKEHIYVGELEENEVHEEDAISELIPYLFGENIKSSKPSEGKINLTSTIDGLFLINSKALYNLNSIGDYTLATIPNYYKVKENQKLVGARIVPLWTDRQRVEKAKEICKENFPLFEVKEFKSLKIGIIITGDEVFYGRIEDKFERVLRNKFSEYKSEILDVKFCPDDLEKIQEALNYYMDKNADLVIFTGGMSVDPDDLTPTAIRKSGADVLFQGVPIQPGNMLTVGKLKNAYLVGVPGASIKSPVTSFDILLPRIFAGVEINKEDFIKMGEGGLCQNCQVCTYPVCYFGV